MTRRQYEKDPEESLPAVATEFDKQVARTQSLARNIPVRRKDGSVFYADINSLPIRFSGAACLMGVFRDVTERKQAEDRLRENESRFRSVIEQSLDGIVLTDEEGHVIEWNRTQEEVTGKRRGEVLHLPLWEAIRLLGRRL